MFQSHSFKQPDQFGQFGSKNSKKLKKKPHQSSKKIRKTKNFDSFNKDNSEQNNFEVEHNSQRGSGNFPRFQKDKVSDFKAQNNKTPLAQETKFVKASFKSDLTKNPDPENKPSLDHSTSQFGNLSKVSNPITSLQKVFQKAVQNSISTELKAQIGGNKSLIQKISNQLSGLASGNSKIWNQKAKSTKQPILNQPLLTKESSKEQSSVSNFPKNNSLEDTKNNFSHSNSNSFVSLVKNSFSKTKNLIEIPKAINSTFDEPKNQTLKNFNDPKNLKNTKPSNILLSNLPLGYSEYNTKTAFDSISSFDNHSLKINNNSEFPNLNYTNIKNNFNYPASIDPKKSIRDAKSTTISRQFALRHTYRAGAIVWVKYRGDNYYVVFRSLNRPSRGVQIPGGRIERMENVAEAVTREVYEEIGVQTRILCPLGFLFTENLSDNFSRIEIYYIVRPIFPIDIFRHWQHTDLDEKRQTLEKQQILDCWCAPVDREVSFLSYEQGQAVVMFREWLSQHKKPKDSFSY